MYDKLLSSSEHDKQRDFGDECGVMYDLNLEVAVGGYDSSHRAIKDCTMNTWCICCEYI